jgi:hypothetical protein
MNHPLTPDLKAMSEADLLKKISELQKRMSFAYSTGNSHLMMQIQMMLEDYKEEQSARDRARLEKMMEDQKDKGKDWDDLIDV